VSKKGNKTTPWWRDKDWTGEQFNNWTVLSYGECTVKPNSKNYHVTWRCQCSCGTIALVDKYNLVTEKSKGCYPCSAKRKLREGNPSWTGNTGVPGRRWSRMVNGARSRGIPVEVDFTYVASLFTGTCALTGMEIDTDDGSIDRIDSSQGYITGNIQWVHKDINKMKNDLNEDWFKLLCKLVADKA
jgi:hypothetical protein